MNILGKIFGNTRKPQGMLGKLMVMGMNSGSHAALAEWGLSHISFKGDEDILDCGCGGGANIAKLLKLSPEGKVFGLDYSEISVAESEKVNREAIEMNRCRILQAGVDRIPMKDECLDTVTAFETVYFWPGLGKCFSEIFRVLKKGGRFLIVNEASGKDPGTSKWTEIIDGMTVYTGDALQAYLKEAGFAKAEIIEDAGHDWLAVLAEK